MVLAILERSPYRPAPSSLFFSFMLALVSCHRGPENSPPNPPPTTPTDAPLQVAQDAGEPTQTRADSPTEPAESSVVVDRAKFGDFELEIHEVDSDCTLQIVSKHDEVQTLELKMLPPCRFVRRDEKLQSFAYPQAALQAVILLSGSPPSADLRASYGLDKLGERGRDCGDKVRGLLISERAELAPEIATMLVCPQVGADEHLFADFVPGNAGGRR